MGELWDVYCEEFLGNDPRYNSTTVYADCIMGMGVTL